MKDNNKAPVELTWQSANIDRTQRARAKNQSPRCVWLTGLSGAGKSTLANELDRQLHQLGRHTMLLDGDNVRQGLCKDLGMSETDRAENIRRVAEVARLMTDAGLIVIAAFISPFQRDRDDARALFPDGEFVEVFVHTPLSVCEERDPKGLYRKARAGEIRDFTGISSPYEEPGPEALRVDTTQASVEAIARSLIERYFS